MENVIELNKNGQIAVIALEEKEFGNTFTQRFIQGLKESFAAIARDPEIKVVIIHGYDNYFCCGGTRSELLNIFEKIAESKETKNKPAETMNFHDIFICCQVPVIAAMQGHALGGGLALGCTADIILMGEQCIYSANFLKYGFTPGFGGSYIISQKLGQTLGNEMLLTAKNYYGRELKERGAPVKIVPKQDVIKTAWDIAGEIADKPLLTLKVLKKHLNREIHARLSASIEEEMEMHRITFNQPEVRTRIEQLFGN